jgi:DNA-binding transcriptional LysR family regulator
MELREIRYFLAVADELHFGRAAARLHISQPPLTQHIKKLEADLGVRLFDRNRRTVKLTASGQAMLDEARRIVGDIEGMRRIVQRTELGETGLLRAGFMSSAPFAKARELYTCLARDMRGISVTWHGLTTSEQVRALQLHQIDLGFIHLPGEHPGLKVQTVVDDRLVLAVHASHPLAGRNSAPLKAFSADGFILPPRASAPGLYDLIIATCNAAGFSPAIPHRARDMLAMISLVSIGSGVSIVPRWLTGAGFPDVCFLDIAGRVPQVQLALAWNPENKSPVLQRALTAFQVLLARPKKKAPSKRASARKRAVA